VTVEAPIPPAYASTNALTTTKVSVANGTSEAAAKAELDASVGVVGTKGETGTATISWTIAGYSATAAGDYTATGVLTLPTGWTGSAANVTATVTVEAPAGFSTAVEVINNAIANFQPVGATGKLGGVVKKVVTGDKKVNKCDFDASTTTINAAKTQTAKLTVNIDTLATKDKTATVAAFPFAEIISGAGTGSAIVANGVLSDDADYYYIQLTDIDCPQSMLNIITAAGNVNSSYQLTFTNQKLTGKIKVSKATGLVVSCYDISIIGDTTIKNIVVNGTYDNEFWNKETIVFSY
ncbi:MAG: hypothetical protein PHU36_09430, partial [Syntrophomonadaceae bacterium]|nr:hypothetical protein [Syntrophomonadaceae bacterium]